MKSRFLSLALAAFMLVTLVQFTATPALAADTGYYELTEFKYDTVRRFSGGMAAVNVGATLDKWNYSFGGKWGYIDATGKEIIPIQYDAAGDFIDGLACVGVGDKVGFIDATGKVVVPLQYESAGNFSEGLAAVRSGGKYGYIDKTGKVVIPFKYQNASEFHDGLARVNLDDMTTFIDKSGKEALSRYGWWSLDFCDGLAAVSVDQVEGMARYVFIDGNDNTVIEQIYADWIPDYADKTGFINRTESFYEGLAWVIYRYQNPATGQWESVRAYINKTGEAVIQLYGWGSPFQGGYATILKLVDGNEERVVIDKEGREIVLKTVTVPGVGEIKLDPVRKGLVGIDVNDKHGFIDVDGSTGRIIVLLQYEVPKAVNIVRTPSEGFAPVMLNSKWGFIAFGEPLVISEAPNLSTASDWAKAGIQSAYDKGFIPADLQNEYKNVITRAEFCRMAVKFVEYKTGKTIDALLADKGLSRNPNAFSDTVDPDILAAYALGITSGTKASNGTTPGTFTPIGEFSREQAATMIRNVCHVVGMSVDNVPQAGHADIGTASSWAVDAINFCYANGIMTGTSSSPLTFSPKATYTREQSIITFNNIK